MDRARGHRRSRRGHCPLAVAHRTSTSSHWVCDQDESADTARTRRDGKMGTCRRGRRQRRRKALFLKHAYVGQCQKCQKGLLNLLTVPRLGVFQKAPRRGGRDIFPSQTPRIDLVGNLRTASGIKCHRPQPVVLTEKIETCLDLIAVG